jgi:Di-haem oxidoreductase, putative peroxidase
MKCVSTVLGVGVVWALALLAQRPHRAVLPPELPRMWDDRELATVELPLADRSGSPRFVPSEYYYRIRVRPIFKSYPVYAPGHEPQRYMEWIKRQEPVILWDDSGHEPLLRRESDWVAAGKIVFDAPTSYDTNSLIRVDDVRDPAWQRRIGGFTAVDGTIPNVRYVVRKKGQVELGSFACGFCHTRIMPDGGILNGAQGNFPFDRAFAFDIQTRNTLQDTRSFQTFLYGAPWIHDGPQASLQGMTLDEIAGAHDAIPPGVIARQRSSPFSPVQVPDLIGIKDRRYLDRTGLQQHRSIIDLMRYAALNQGGDDLATFGNFRPMDLLGQFPSPTDDSQSRYSDEQLYALALYLYSLQPPPNPNKYDDLAQRGQRVFERVGCAACHRPPLYTNNKLTPAEGFTVPDADRAKFDILPISVGTDATLTTKTRRGTGYYKVPSLRGVWYRGPFEHNGSVATLEDWFDARRLRDDYVPTGFRGYRVNTRAVRGHQFGLEIAPDEKRALIAFLKTL